MKTRYYLYTSGELKRQDDSLVFLSGEQKTYIPIHQIDVINSFGHLDFNKNVILVLNRHGITMNFFNFFGRFIGTYVPDNPKYGKVILAHAEHVSDEEKRTFIAKEITQSAIANMLFVLKYYDKKYAIFKDEINIITDIQKKIDHAFDSNNIMLLEAQAKQRYYQTIPKIIKDPRFIFNGRSIRPPKDEVNAMMSFGYAMLYGLFSAIIHRSSLHISLPFIHSTKRRTEGLQYDLADIFKPILVDRVIFRMINKKMITPLDFDHRDDGVYMNKSGMNKFILEFELQLRNTVNIQGSIKSYRQMLAKEVHALSNHIQGKKTYYGFKLTRW